MLDLYLEFMSYITRNLTEYVKLSKNSVTYGKVLYIYTLLDRIAHNFESFAQILVYWQQHTCEGGAWAGAHGRISIIDNTMHILGDDLNDLISVHRSDKEIKRCRFRGGPALSKFDVFDIWEQIVHRNAVDRFSGWVSDHNGEDVRRTIYIPNYSLLLPTVQRTSQLSNTLQSQWQQVDFNFLEAVTPDLNQKALSFLPEFPPEFQTNTEAFNRLAKPAYAQVIEMPAQDKEMAKVITMVQNCTTNFRASTNGLRDELVMQGKNTPGKLFNAF